MKRLAVNVAHFRSPLRQVQFAGLGAWPAGRAYYDVSHFRAPYQSGMLLNAPVDGLGAAPGLPVLTLLPDKFQLYMQTGQPMQSTIGDLQSTLNQIPRWAWAVLAAGASALAYTAYKRHKKEG